MRGNQAEEQCGQQQRWSAKLTMFECTSCCPQEDDDSGDETFSEFNNPVTEIDMLR